MRHFRKKIVSAGCLWCDRARPQPTAGNVDWCSPTNTNFIYFIVKKICVATVIVHDHSSYLHVLVFFYGFPLILFTQGREQCSLIFSYDVSPLFTVNCLRISTNFFSFCVCDPHTVDSSRHHVTIHTSTKPCMLVVSCPPTLLFL